MRGLEKNISYTPFKIRQNKEGMTIVMPSTAPLFEA
jgi:hypothetical protein